MAANTKAKKEKKAPNLKMRKAVRRTLAGLFMASAIIVAAIPARDTTAKISQAEASNTVSSLEHYLVSNTQSFAYLSGMESADFENSVLQEAQKQNNMIYYKGGTSGKTDYSYVIEDGKCDWQFQYFTYDFGASGEKAIIYRYNNAYNTDTVKIPKNLVSEYKWVSDQWYAAFLSEVANQAVALKYDYTFNETDLTFSGDNFPSADKLKYYFKNAEETGTQGPAYVTYNIYDGGISVKENYIDEINSFREKYNQDKNEYLSNLAALTNTDPDYNIKKAKLDADYTTLRQSYDLPDQEVSSTIQGILSTEELYMFFCDMVFVQGMDITGFPGDNFLAGGSDSWKQATLVKIDKSDTVEDQYLVKTLKPYSMDGFIGSTGSLRTDKDGYIYSRFYPCYGIGAYYAENSESVEPYTAPTKYIKGAFAEIQNVTQVILDEDVELIGPYAFYHSFLTSIEMNITDIGPRAFKNCEKLQSVTLADGTQSIGTEAFYGCSSLVNCKRNADSDSGFIMPPQIKEIRTGAFANCTAMNSLSLNNVNTPEKCDIYDYAFYGCTNLSSLSMDTDFIASIGNGVFALPNTGGSLTEASLPNVTKAPMNYSGSRTTGTASYGDYLFFNRNTLERVNIPGNYSGTGASSPVYLFDNVFGNCYNLQCLHFDDKNGNRCSYVEFNGDNLFSDIGNEEFYVFGPQFSVKGQEKPLPRLMTLGSGWGGATSENPYVPYVYERNGERYYETQSGNYYLTVNEQGVLENCDYANVAEADPNLVIPKKVATQTIKELAQDCFSDDVKKTVRKVTISDDSIEKIGADVFNGFGILEKVVIGAGVSEIGARAFQNCPKLVDVQFNHQATDPLSIVEGSPDGAFLTGSMKLTFRGPISSAFPPYTYAVNPSNYVDEATSVRICYISTSPSFLTVMYNDATKQVTLLNYPKYNMLDTDHADYLLEQQEVWYKTYYGNEGNNNRYNYACALIDYACKTKLGREASWDTVDEENGPWVNAQWLGNSDSYPGQLYNTAPGLINTDYLVHFYENYYQDLVDNNLVPVVKEENSLFGPMKVYAATPSELSDILGLNDADKADKIMRAYQSVISEHVNAGADTEMITQQDGRAIPYFNAQIVNGTTYDHIYSILKNRESSHGGVGLNVLESDWINACENIVVPDGVDSIDAYAYFSDPANITNIKRYFDESLIGKKVKGMYTGDSSDGSSESVDKNNHPGLFSGYYIDYDYTTDLEKKGIGNDFVRSIKLTSVKELPDYCFESCERLESVDLGDELEKIGKAPFRGCSSLSDVSSTGNVFGVNGIIYSRKDDDTYKILECLSSRGKAVGSTIVSTGDETDGPYLTQVSEIEEGAFSDCDDITKVFLTDAVNLTTIPKSCFEDCDKLNEVRLPESVNLIEDDAFKNDTVYVEIPSKEVQIADSAFDHNYSSTIRTPSDSAAARYGNTHAVNVEPYDKYKVSFIDWDATEISVQYVKDGESATLPPDQVRSGYTFIGWRPVGKGTYNEVHENQTYIAQYSANPDDSGGGGTVSGGSKVSGGTHGGGGGSSGSSSSSKTKYRLIVEYGSGDGEYEKDTKVSVYANDPPSGNVFDKWVIISGLTSIPNAQNRYTSFSMPTNEVRLRATYRKDTSTSGNGSRSSSVSSRNSRESESTKKNTGKTSVVVNSAGISNQDLANAVVHGSTDNFVVKISQDDATTGQVEEALRATYGSLDNLLYYPMNIQLFNAAGTTQIMDTSGLTVDITVPLPDGLRSYGGNNKVAAIRAGSLESLAPRFTSISGVPCVTFTASHFSPYVIWTDTAHLSDSMDENPKTGDIEPKWFLSLGLAAVSLLLFFKKDRPRRKAAT